jgi:hypothetical protein
MDDGQSCRVFLTNTKYSFKSPKICGDYLGFSLQNKKALTAVDGSERLSQL